MKRLNLFVKNILFILFLLFSYAVYAKSVFNELEIIKEILATSVKNQLKTEACRSFGTASFIESELKGKNDLSELYVCYHSSLNFGSGTEGWDMFNRIDVLIYEEKSSTVWHKAVNCILDVYLGKYPNEFVYDNVKRNLKNK